MSASYAKNAQNCSPALQSTACVSPLDFKPTHRAGQRSMTAERGFRDMGNVESSFFYERPPKEEVLKEMVQSPYMEGRKNTRYLNPTFHSSLFLNQNMELQRSKTPDVRAFSRSNTAGNVNNAPNVADNAAGQKCHTTQTPREAVCPTRNVEAPVVNQSGELRPTEIVERHPRHSRIGSVVEESRQNIENDFNEQRQLKSSRSESSLNVCTGCHNWNLADETTNKRKRERDAERELERAVLELNGQLLRRDQEKERARKELIVEASHKNYDLFTQKRERDSSVEGRHNGDYNVEIKLNNPSVATESMKCLQRYQSMMDKMYDASVKKNEQRKAELGSGNSLNKKLISRNEQIKAQEKKTGAHVQWDLGNGKSLLDKINDKAADTELNRTSEKRRASEYNCKTGSEQKEARKKSPLDVPESPFKVSSAEFEKSTEGKSLLDTMYQSSLDYWKKQKQNLTKNSQLNKSTGEFKRSRHQQRDFQDEFERDYTSPIGRNPTSEYRNENKISFVDKINNNDIRSAGLRNDRSRDCSSHNKGRSFFEENNRVKPNMEAYYNSPTKKVGNTYEIESAGWTNNDRGLFHKIDKSSAQLNENRRQQLSETGTVNKQQIVEGSTKKKEQQIKDRNFKEDALIVCAHKANLMYCNLCNRKVPMNKITKVVADYNKMIKNRQQRIQK